MTAGLLQLVVIVLPACGGGGSGCDGGNFSNPNAVLYSVPTLQDVGNYYALTEYTCSGPTIVKVSQETPGMLVTRVVAHEMLHAAGLVEHEASPACFLYKDAYPGQPASPCNPEIDRLRELERTITIRVLDAALVETCLECADMWNDVAGREVFVIVDQSPPAPAPAR